MLLNCLMIILILCIFLYFTMKCWIYHTFKSMAEKYLVYEIVKYTCWKTKIYLTFLLHFYAVSCFLGSFMILNVNKLLSNSTLLRFASSTKLKFRLSLLLPPTIERIIYLITILFVFKKEIKNLKFHFDFLLLLQIKAIPKIRSFDFLTQKLMINKLK